MYHSVEKEYKAASEVYKQMNDREIALQRDIRNLIDQQKFQEEIVAAYPGAEPSKDYLNTLLKELTQRLHELEGKMNQYQLLYSEWQRNDELIKKMRNHCEVVREKLNQLRLLMQQTVAIEEQLQIFLQNEFVIMRLMRNLSVCNKNVKDC